MTAADRTTGSRPIYLDHNATTPVAPEVAQAMWPYITEHFGNPSSSHRYGRIAKAAVDHAREQVAALIGARPDEVVFTSGGTEANNLAIRGSAALAGTAVAVTTAVEHPATTAPLALLSDMGWTVHRLPVDAEGRAHSDAVPAGPIGLGTAILAQNEVGTIQPVQAIAEAVHRVGGVMHTDAAQAVGKIPVNVGDLGVDLLSIAGHKLYAPKAVGALYARRGTALSPVLVGAGQEAGLRPGTENVAGIVALGAACELAASLLPTEPDRQAELREHLWSTLCSFIPGLVRLSPSAGCLPNTLMIAVPGLVGADVLDATPQLAASTGSACHSGVHTPAATLLAMGVDGGTAIGAIRLSLGRSSTRQDVRDAAAFLAQAVRQGLASEG
jgi:cysteine desulfurase